MRACGLLAVLLFVPGWLAAQGLDSEQNLEVIRAELAVLTHAIDAGDTLQARRQSSERRQRLVSIRNQARECTTQTLVNLENLGTRRAALGEQAGVEDSEVAALRRQLAADITSEEKRRAACEQIVQASQDMLDRIEARQQAVLVARLFAQGPSTTGILFDAIAQPREWSRLVSGFLTVGSGWERLSPNRRGAILAVFVVLAATGIGWRRRWHARHPQPDNRRHLVAAAPWLLSVGGAAILLLAFLPSWPPALISRLTLGVLAWFIVDVMQHIWLARRQSAGLAEADARSLLGWFRILLALAVAGGLVITADVVIGLPDPHYFLLRSAMAWLLVVGVVWSAALLGRVPGLAGTRFLRSLLVLAVLATAIAETLGYRNLSIYLLVGFSGTIIGFVSAGFVSRGFLFLFDGLDEGRYDWQKSLREWMGLKLREPVPGLVWLRLATSLLVWSAFIVWVLWIWGQSERWLGVLVEYTTSGFDVGSLHIAPLPILGAIAVLAIGVSLTRWLKQRVIPDMIGHSRLDRGGREAMVTLSGYAGMILSLLVALGIAGISYTNLAIIAGALSVGIGFGLQNVVNNFVSGLILLFERPIRTGDWVVVGDVQGYVRKISIRSTQIETFDRADIIVPNSELIAGKVSNWMLRDPWGRLTIPVGVAYGSDVEEVVDVLLRVAHAHESVLRDQAGIAPPKALFRRFGDSALEFELRCFIRQIDRFHDVTHDLNMAIDRAFREAGITIPFPQRDVHVRTLPETGSAEDT
jgi:potassium efflux system protein